MMKSNVERMLAEQNQEQVLRFFYELSAEEQADLLAQAESIDWSVIAHWNCREELSGKGEILPMEGLSVAEIEKRKGELFTIGKKAIIEGKVGAVLLAGGQGTRLGSDAPKGTYNIGLTRKLTIFEQLLDNLKQVCSACGASVPLFIMTSEKNDKDTRDFFKKNEYFGYPQKDIYFFQQDMFPSVDFSGKILLEEKGRIATSPNGNGGWYSSLMKGGLKEEIERRGIEWFNVFAVDNVLQRIADPLFIGATIVSGKNCGAKVVSKAEPHERVGVLCLENGNPNIIEYYELTEEMANARNEKGELAFRFGVILNYLFRVEKLREIEKARFPVHVVKKKIPYVSKNGEMVRPSQENGYKFETLILDMVKLMGSCLPFEIVREREFAPIKNPTGVDSVESARKLLQLNGVQL